jgi:hypothetical protein
MKPYIRYQEIINDRDVSETYQYLEIGELNAQRVFDMLKDYDLHDNADEGWIVGNYLMDLVNEDDSEIIDTITIDAQVLKELIENE